MGIEQMIDVYFEWRQKSVVSVRRQYSSLQVNRLTVDYSAADKKLFVASQISKKNNRHEVQSLSILYFVVSSVSCLRFMNWQVLHSCECAHEA